MASVQDIFLRFVKKTEADEKIMRARYPEIFTFAQSSVPVPVMVLQNYMVARDDVQARINKIRDLLRAHADPRTGVRTPDPIPMPAFGVKTGGGQFAQLGDADARAAINSLAELARQSPKALIAPKDIVFDSIPTPPQDTGLGIEPITIAVIGLVIALSGLTIAFVISKLTQEEVKLAEQAVEFERQANFARVWDTAKDLIRQCIGSNPTPERITSCWTQVAARVPELVRTIPDHKLSTGGGILATVGKVVVGAAVLVGGYFAWQALAEHKAKKKKAENEQRESDARVAAIRAQASTSKKRKTGSATVNGARRRVNARA